MDARHGAWWVPAGSFLAAVLLSLGSHSSIRALTMRLAAEPTPADCTIVKLEFVPVLQKVKVERIKSVSGNAKKPVITSEAVDQMLVDTNPGPGGGKRIYVGRKDIKDSREHDIIVVLATVANAKLGTIVTFEAMDVDDPSAGDTADGNLKTTVNNRLANVAEVDHVTLLENSLNHDDTPVVDWEEFCFDNRGDIIRQSGGHKEGMLRNGCDFKTWMESNLTKEEVASLKAQGLTDINFHGLNRPDHSHDTDVVSIICKRGKVPVNKIEPDGTAKVAVILNVSRQPGDNYKVLAMCGEPTITYNLKDDNGKGYGQVVYTGDKIFDKTVPVQDDGTISRVLMRERPIKSPKPPGPCRKFNIIFDNHDPSKVKITELLTVWRRLHVELDYMESTANSTNAAFPSFNAIQNPGTNEDYPIPFAGPGGENTPLITPDLRGMQRDNMYPKAYVDVVDDMSSKVNKVPLRVFQHNIGGNLIGVKDIDGIVGKTRDCDHKEERNLKYWVVHLVGGYEHDGQKSNDPNGQDGGNTLSGLASGLSELDLLSAMAFHETVRDVVKMGGNFVVEGGGGQLGAKTAAQILQDTYAHEATHQFDFPKHGDGGIMSVRNVYFTANPGLSDFSLAKIRSSNGP